MEVRDMTIEQVEEELTNIAGEMESLIEKLSADETDEEEVRNIDARSTELKELRAKLIARKKELIEERNAKISKIEEGAGNVKKIEGEKVMTFEEIRSSQEYLEAYAEYLKTGDDAEVRSVLSEAVTVSGTSGVPLPTYVEEKIRTAWEKDEILSRCRRTNVKGNLKVGFELSATDAAVHTEGGDAPSEETLNLGTVTLVPETLKKWITISDEVLDVHGQAFLDYIFDEIEHKIAQKAADTVISDITSSPTTATTTAASVSQVESTGIADIINAFALLSAEATNPVIIMNRQSYAYYKGLAIAANYAVDPFDGLEVLFNDTLSSAADTPDSGETNYIAIVGDLQGEQLNFPNAYQTTFKFDDLSLAEEDLVKVVGRLPMAHGVTACGRFTVITKTGE